MMADVEPILEVIVGTYEQFLLGYSLKKIEDSYVFEQTFTNHAHTSSVRSLASSSKHIASGSVDEAIRIFNMRKRTDVGTLIQHEGTVSHAQFYSNSHLFTCSEDGTICVWETKNWECEKTLRGHKDGVNCLSVHPSGKMLLSVSKDKTLRTWNLIKGRCAYVTNLKSVSHLVAWSSTGTHFAVVIDNKMNIYDISIGGVVHNIQFGKRINCLTFLNNSIVLIGGDHEDVQIHDIHNKCLIHTFKAHDNRLKSIECVKDINAITGSENVWVVTSSSDGYIKLWEMNEKNLQADPKQLASVNTTCRPTCSCVWIPDKRELPSEKTSLTCDESQEENVSKDNKESESGKKRRTKLKSSKGKEKKLRLLND